jgi:hypothetical protein
MGKFLSAGFFKHARHEAIRAPAVGWAKDPQQPWATLGSWLEERLALKGPRRVFAPFQGWIFAGIVSQGVALAYFRLLACSASATEKAVTPGLKRFRFNLTLSSRVILSGAEVERRAQCSRRTSAVH